MSDSETKQKYTLTEEHRAQLEPWAQRWIKNALKTTSMSAEDKIACAEHVRKLYQAADYEPPEFVFFVPSPYVACVIAGFASAIDAKGDANSKYTIPQMVDLVLNSIKGVDLKSSPDDKWLVTPYKVREISALLELDKGNGPVIDAIEHIRSARNMWNGGNQWSAWISYITFFRYVVKLDIDYTKWDPYEKLGELSGPRLLHKRICVISDFPSALHINARNQPHNDNGPFCEWRDGTKLYAVNGVRVPGFVLDNPKKITIQLIEKETNAEVRRVMITKYGQDRFLIDSNATVVHQDDFGTLYRKEITGDEPLMMVKVVNSTAEPDGSFKDYFIRVDPNAYGGLKTARAAVASTWRNSDGTLMFQKPEDYGCDVET